jgi:hypothetical protein
MAIDSTLQERTTREAADINSARNLNPYGHVCGPLVHNALPGLLS